jgi:hypothetical protein
MVLPSSVTLLFVNKYLAAHVAQDSDGEEIVDKARELMS